MEDATNGVDNCISVAFGVCNEKSCLLANMERQEDDTNKIVAISAPLISRINLCGLNDDERKPSDILTDQAKVDLLVLTFDLNKKLNTLADHKLLLDILKKENLLFVLLKACFHTHVKQTAKLCQQSNRCLPWASKNLVLVAS
jgi:hypothetical protein